MRICSWKPCSNNDDEHVSQNGDVFRFFKFVMLLTCKQLTRDKQLILQFQKFEQQKCLKIQMFSYYKLILMSK